MPASLIPVTIFFDGTGEPDPYKFESQFIKSQCRDKGIQLLVVRKRLTVGDYTIHGMEDTFTVERKKLNDLVGRLSQPGRKANDMPGLDGQAKPVRNKRKEFFDRQVDPMSKMARAAIMVEADWSDITWQRYRSDIHPNSVKATVAAIIARFNVPVFFFSDRAGAEEMTFLVLMQWLKHFNPAIGQ